MVKSGISGLKNDPEMPTWTNLSPAQFKNQTPCLRFPRVSDSHPFTRDSGSRQWGFND